MKQIQKPTTKKMKLYLFCRNTITILLTFAALIPFIYLLGSDESFYSAKPLYEAYSKNAYFQAKVSEVEAALNSSLIVNIYSQQAHEKKQSSMRQWEHLREFVSYLGYHFNQNGLLTVDRLITPPEIKQQKKGKGAQNSGNQRLLEYAYSLENFGEMNTLRNKINKAASGIITRLKIKSKVSKSPNLAENLKNKIVGEVLGNKVWLITIHPDFWQFHSSEELRKQLATLSKQRQKDRFIVISIGPADPEWKKMKNISINLEETVISSMKDSFKDIISNYFSFQINATRVIQTILCQSQTSLFQLNNFLHRCNTSFSCYNSIKIFRKEKVKKGDKNTVRSYVDQLCQQGQISQDDSDFIKILRDLGFAPVEESQNQEIQNNLKVYYEIANGKKCKGNKRCNFEWLETSKPLNETNTKVEDADEQKKPVAEDQEEEIQPVVVETITPNITKTQEKKPSTKTKKEEKESNATKTTLQSNETNENQANKESKEQKPSKIKSKSKKERLKVTKSQNTFSAEVNSKEQVKAQNKKADKNKSKKQAKAQSKGKKAKKVKVTNPEEMPEAKDVEHSKDQQANNVVTIAGQQKEEIKGTNFVSEIPAVSNEESSKQQVASTQKAEQPANPDVQSEQRTDIQPESINSKVDEIPCDNQNGKTCQSIPSVDQEQPATQIHDQAASLAQQDKNKQADSEQATLASEQALPTHDNPTIQLENQNNIEEVPEDKNFAANSEEINPQTVEEAEQEDEIPTKSPETIADNIQMTNEPSTQHLKDTQGSEDEEIVQNVQSEDPAPATNDQSL